MFLVVIIVVIIVFAVVREEDNQFSPDYFRGEIEEFEKTNTSFNFLWSKGLEQKDDYSLIHTEQKSKNIDITRDTIWIRLSSNGNTTDITYFANKLLPKIKTPKTIVTSDGDCSVPSDLKRCVVDKILNNKNITRWYTQNFDGTLNHEKLKRYPIGVDLHHKNLFPVKKVLNLLSIRNKPKKTINKIFCDVHLSQNKKFNNERKRVYEILEDYDKVDFLDKRIPQEQIWENYSSYDLTISTHGNGLDCHRTWEIILLGGIVVTKTSSLDSLYKDLPVIIVSDWRECMNFDLDEIKNRFKHMKSNDYIYKFFKYNHWLND